MTNIIFAVLLSWNMNIWSPFDEFGKNTEQKNYEKTEEGRKMLYEDNYECYIV